MNLIKLNNKTKKILLFIKNTILEIKNITWENKVETIKITFLILISSTLISLFILLIDRIVFYLVAIITSIKS